MPIQSPDQTDAVVFQRAFLAGLAIWALATGILRTIGHKVLFAEPASLLVLFAAVGILTASLAPFLRHWVGASSKQAEAVALVLLIPGMLLDAGATGLFAEIFPNMSSTLAPYFGALMLWAYGVAGASMIVEARISRPITF